MISEFPLFLFTTLAGASAGLAAVNALFPLPKKRKRPWLLPLACLVLLGAGLLGCLGHLGRPERFLNALANPSAGIVQEAYASIVFGVLLLVDLVATARKGASPRALDVACGAVGLVLAVVMGCAYLVNLGTPAWSAWPTVPLFVVGDIVLGATLYTLFDAGAYGKAGLLGLFVAAAVLFAAALGFEGAHFASVGYDAAPFAAAAVLAAAGGVLGLVARKRPSRALDVAVFAVVLVSVCVARWFFYAASIV